MKLDLWLIIAFHIRYVANPINVLAKIATEGGETPAIVLGKVVAGDAVKLEVLDLKWWYNKQYLLLSVRLHISLLIKQKHIT